MKLMDWRFFVNALLAEIPLEEIVDELRDFDERFVAILQKHLAVLGWWCALHLLAAVPGLFLLKGMWWYFLLMNLSWAVINFTVVLWIFDHVFYRRFARGNTFDRFEVHWHVERMLLLNIGLDTAYVFAGLYLHTLGQVPGAAYPELWTGFGWAVILQGVFLFGLDNFFRRLHLRNFYQARQFLEERLAIEL